MADLCECGCREVTVPGNRFIHGHHRRGVPQSPEHKRKIADANRGQKRSLETRERISAVQRGRVQSAETREKRGAALKGKLRDERHPLWKGEQATYSSIHRWLGRNKPKTGVCFRCLKTVGIEKRHGTQWANLSGRYLRDFADYAEMCRPCHAAFDGERKAK